MDKELIERLWVEAGLGYWDTLEEGIVRFASLIAEECAKTALLQVNPVRDDSDEWHRVCAAAAENCATAIRAKFKPT